MCASKLDIFILEVTTKQVALMDIPKRPKCLIFRPIKLKNLRLMFVGKNLSIDVSQCVCITQLKENQRKIGNNTESC